MRAGWEATVAKCLICAYVRSSVVPVGKSIRRLRFRALEKLVLPTALGCFRALMRTWRMRGPDPALMDEVATLPRVIFTLWHGTLLQGLFFTGLWERYDRCWVVLVTPSLDGLLAATMLGRFGVECAALEKELRGVASAGLFIQRLEEGFIGAILADGPRGPQRVVKAGVGRTAAAAGARLVVAGFAASHGVRFPSWDRTVIPAPFARVAVSCRLLPPPAGQGYSVDAIQAGLEAATDDAVRLLAAGRSRGPLSTAPMTP
jgi:lysophospholipid acyltransferase (LPLAT)-like uncharacterized protein